MPTREIPPLPCQAFRAQVYKGNSKWGGVGLIALARLYHPG